MEVWKQKYFGEELGSVPTLHLIPIQGTFLGLKVRHYLKPTFLSCFSPETTWAQGSPGVF